MLSSAPGAAAAIDRDSTETTPAARARFRLGRHSSGPQELLLDTAYHLRTPVWIGGMKVSAMVDTGAGRTVLDRALAARLGIATRLGFNVAGITADSQGEFADDLKIDIGDLTLTGIKAGVLDLGPLSTQVDDPIGIILGRELFANTRADIDFIDNQIEFFDPASPTKIPLVPPLRLQQSVRGTPHIPLVIGPGLSIEAGFDIGYNAALLLSPSYADQMGLLRGKRVSTVASQGVEGISVNRVATLDSVRLGDTTIANVPIEIPSSWTRSMPAVLGLEILKRFHIVTDYPHERAWFSPYRSLIGQPLPKDRSGIGAAPFPEGLLVVHVAKGSPAELAGLMARDQIVAIDGEKIDANYISTHPRMGTRPSGTAFSLSLSDGRILHLELADYY